MPTAAVTAVATLLVAALGYLFTYMHTRRVQQRRDQLDRVNWQLGELYGPAFALSGSTRISFEAFCEEYGDLRAYKAQPESLTLAERDAWIAWMQTIFQPANKRIHQAIMRNADLLVGDEIPESVSIFFAHVAAYDVVMSRWKADDVSVIFAPIDYPIGGGPCGAGRRMAQTWWRSWISLSI